MKHYWNMTEEERKEWDAKQEVFNSIQFALKVFGQGELTRSEVVDEIRDVMVIHHLVNQTIF